MGEIVDAAHKGLPVLGICNGFQVLTEAHLLPGSMIKNDHLHFVCREQVLVGRERRHRVDPRLRARASTSRSR